MANPVHVTIKTFEPCTGLCLGNSAGCTPQVHEVKADKGETITFHNHHTSENITVTFFVEGSVSVQCTSVSPSSAIIESGGEADFYVAGERGSRCDIRLSYNQCTFDLAGVPKMIVGPAF